MEGLAGLVVGEVPAEMTAAVVDIPPVQAIGTAPHRDAAGFVGFRKSDGTCAQVQGFLYGSVIAGTLPLVLALSRLQFTLPYQVLALLAGVLSYFSLQNLRLTSSWDIRMRGGNGAELLLRWTKLVAGLALFGFASGYRQYYYLHVLLIWFVAAPLSLVLIGTQLRDTIASGHSSNKTRQSGKARRAVLVFANETTRQFASRLQASQSHDLLGYFDDRDFTRPGDVLANIPRLGASGDLADYVAQNHIEVVFVSLSAAESDRSLSVAEMLGDTTASLYFIPDFCPVNQFGVHATEVNSMPVLEVMETPFYGADGLLKRICDIAFSLAALAALAVPMMIIAVAVRATSQGPALFLQKRYGLNGREFRVFKFRTMYTADRSQEIAQVSRQDRRVTPIGRFLRRTSLDELPQFLNVLMGSMSVVGPRPHTIAHNEYYRGQVKRYMSRHKVKPGITGLAQVNGMRGETSTIEMMDARIRYDIEYIRNWSVSSDMTIILKTALMFLRDKNAY